MKVIIESQHPVKSLINESLAKAKNYQEYKKEIANHVANGTNSGVAITPDLANYTLLNERRMKRLDKTLQLPEFARNALDELKESRTWLVLTESWCGDAAHALPMMQKFVEQNSKLDLKIISRDANPELMDEFLTGGSRSIPKLIALDANQKVLGTWGPRPSVATALVNKYREEHGSLTPEFKKDLQVWYNKDKAQNIAQDLTKVL